MRSDFPTVTSLSEQVCVSLSPGDAPKSNSEYIQEVFVFKFFKNKHLFPQPKANLSCERKKKLQWDVDSKERVSVRASQYF